MHLAGVAGSPNMWRKTRRPTRTTPWYSPTPMPNSTASSFVFQWASAGNEKRVIASITDLDLFGGFAVGFLDGGFLWVVEFQHRDGLDFRQYLHTLQFA